MKFSLKHPTLQQCCLPQVAYSSTLVADGRPNDRYAYFFVSWWEMTTVLQRDDRAADRGASLAIFSHSNT